MFKIQPLSRRPFCAAVIFLYALCPVFGADLKILPGHVSKAIARLSPFGELPATNELRMAIGLPLHNGVELDAFIKQLSDPASPGFRQYLTPEEFTARFGPTAQDYEAVKTFACTNGLTVVGTFDNRLVLDVTGPAAAVEKAFHIKLRTYHHPTEARDFFAPDSEPTVDTALPIVDIQGLSNLGRPQPKFKQLKTADPRPKTGSAPDSSGGYFGNDFRNAYAPGVTLTGAGQSVSLFEADGFYSADISYYAAQAGNGRSNIVIQTVLLDSFNGTPTTGQDSGNPEVSLDIEMAMAMAPGLSKIIVFEGNPNNYLPNSILSAMLSSNSVKILSCSWGWTNGPSSTTDTIFTNMAAIGQTFFNASGDSCAFTTGLGTADSVDDPNSFNAPSDSPIITQVGATTLTMNGTGVSYASETVWNWGIEIGSQYDGVGSSGGISSFYTIPSWQATVSGLTAAGGSTSYRNLPDVALTGDNVYVRDSDGNNDNLGGTSCAAPLWAGFIALVNQQAAAAGKPVVGFINPALYNIAEGAEYSSCFNDVTTGNNTWSGSPDLFYATNGYDLCTGWGTPAGTALINALANGLSLIVSPLAGTASGLPGGPFTITSGSFTLSNATSSNLNWTLINPASWLAFSSTNGTLAGAGHTTITASITAAANSLAVGTYTANLSFSNLTGQTAQPALFTLQVNQPLVVSPTNGFTSAGLPGGPFSVTSQNYSLSNQSAASLPWTFVNPVPWLSLSASNGTLAAHAQTVVTVSLTAAANTLASGVYTGNLQVTNAYGVAATLPATLNIGQSIVTNGGFETGNFSGWTQSGNTADTSVESGSSFAHSGTYGVALGPTSLGYLSQTLATLPGQNYFLSLWLENPSNPYGATPNQFLVEWNGNTLFNQSNIPYTAWTNLQFIVSATSTSTLLQFGFDDGPYFLGLDDISVVPITPPVFKTAQAASPNINLGWTTISNLTYQVQYATNAAQTNWINLGAPQTATGATLNFTDTNALTSSPHRYYRIVLVP